MNDKTKATCPSCGASDSNPYIDANGIAMRACGRCMIQWRVGLAAAPSDEQLLAAVREIYYAGLWECKSIPLDEQIRLWTNLRDAAGFEPGHSPKGEDSQS